jgi:hypothetical protein
MRTRWVVAIPGIAWALACPGCRPEGLHPVSGRVLYQGEPAAGATVYFHRAGAAAPAVDVIPTGVVGGDGRFRLASGDADGAPAGTYHVLIEWLDRPSSSKGGALVRTAGPGKGARKAAAATWRPGPSRVRPPDRLNGRYFDIEHPLVKAEVKPGTNNLSPFELTD